jgi:hypothetical protein
MIWANAYTAAITDYMRKPKVVETQNRDTIAYSISKPGFTLAQVQVLPDDTTASILQKVIVRKQNERWLVYYTPDAGTSRPLTLIITDNAQREFKLSVIS